MRSRSEIWGLVAFLLLIFAIIAFVPRRSETVITTEGSQEPVQETNGTNHDQIYIYSTRNSKEYLEFLTNLEEQYEIIDITTGMSTYSRGDSYMVTYKLKDEWKNENPQKQYKYYLYETRRQENFLQYYSNLNIEKYEIVDISTRLSTYSRGESYMITYRELID